MRHFVFIIIVMLSENVNADWISLCKSNQPVENAQTKVLRRIETGDGKIVYLIATQNLPDGTGCSSSPVPFKQSQILWSALLNESSWKSVNDALRIFFIGKLEDQRFKGEIAWPDGPDHIPAESVTWPANFDLRSHLEITPFGEEERADIRREKDSLVLHCGNGTRPAGFLIPLGSHILPKLIDLSLSINYRGSGRWGMGRVDSRAPQGDPVRLAALEADSDWQTSRLRIDGHLKDSTSSLTFICPNEDAAIEFGDVQLQAPTLSQPPARSTWIWEPADWQSRTDRFWSRLSRLEIKRLFITVLLDDSGRKLLNPEQLRAFIREAASHQIDVWAVEGNPGAVLPEEHEKWMARARAFQDYNASVGIGDQLQGIQFDIEPYLNEGYQLNPDQWKTAYIELLRGMHDVLEMPVDVAIPVWWGQETLAGKSLMEALTEVVDGVTVMDYQTDPYRILHMANPILSWGVTHRKHVNIALESVNLGTETRWTFEPSAVGDLFGLRLGQAVVFIRTDTAIPGGAKPTFLFKELSESRSEHTTFYGKPEILENLLKPLENSFRVWASFQGLALHEVLKNQKSP